MSQLAQCMGKQRLMTSWAIALGLASFSALCVLAQGVETKDKTELVERQEFIQKAMDERIREQAAEMAERGMNPRLIVTTLVPFGDWDLYWVKGGSIRWQPNAWQKLQEVIVPEGFVSDLASIPRVFWQVLRPEGRYAYAAVVHDYLYWTQTRPRGEADQIFKIAMEDSKVDPKTVETVYQAVHRFGQAAWDNNARLKRAGECRFLRRFPQDFTISWSEWKKQPDVFEEKCERKRFSLGAYAQSAKNLKRDLSVSFASESGKTEYGAVYGEVTNTSANAYPCVRLEFTLYGTPKSKSDLGPPLGVVPVEVRDVGPHLVRKYYQSLPYLAPVIAHTSVSECSEQRNSQSVVIYENQNFEGRSRSFGIGNHRLFTTEDFNDLTSSIKVPAGLAVTVYEHADEGGGYGIWVDFLEDQPDLSQYDFNHKISYLVVFDSQRPGYFYARNSMQNGEFVPGHWERVRARGNPVNPNPVVGPSRPPNDVPGTPPVSGFCTISGFINRDSRAYNTRVDLYRPGSKTPLFSTAVNGRGQYNFSRVPVGDYLVIPKGTYPEVENPGRMGGIGPIPYSQRVSCQPNGSHRADFRIGSSEG
jgi:uncharacterized protein DUF1353